MYPVISLPRIANPKRLYAIPFFGGMIKSFMLIPAFFWLMIVSAAYIFIMLLNSFVVLFTGKYWQVAYNIASYFVVYSLKVNYFYFGLTNTYPGFSSQTTDFTVTIAYPEHPNRLFAIPIFGGIARGILLIPYLIYATVMLYGAIYGSFAASLVILFKGTYPESFYEMERDSVRLLESTVLYLSGLSDTYPSWWISMNHKTTKIILIIIGILAFLFRSGHSTTTHTYTSQPTYQQTQTGSY